MKIIKSTAVWCNLLARSRLAICQSELGRYIQALRLKIVSVALSFVAVLDETGRVRKVGKGLLDLSKDAGVEFALDRLFDPADRAKDRTLLAIYDLGREPITFDFLYFIAAVDLERRRRGLDNVHFLFVPGPKDGFRDEWPDYERIVDHDARRWRISNLLLPCLRLLPSCAGHTICGSRTQASIVTRMCGYLYPPNYDAESTESVGYIVTAYHEVFGASRQGKSVDILRGTEQARRYVKHWLDQRAAGRKVISITLREYGYYRSRNSNLADWARFARRLDPAEYFPVILRDLDAIFDPVPGLICGLPTFEVGPANLELRMALYEQSYLNLGSNNGPMALCMLSENIPYIVFKILTPGVPQADEEFLIKLGIEIDAPHMPFASQYQKRVWEDDTLETIEREFLEMCEKLEKSEKDNKRRSVVNS